MAFNEAVNSIMQGIEQGIVTPDDVESLQKAITAGYGGAGKPTDLTHGGVIQTESLETTLKSVMACYQHRQSLQLVRAV